MTQNEISGTRWQTYSTWHRDLGRFVGAQAADACDAIDLDSVEFCRRCYRILAFVESAGCYRPKDYPLMRRAASRCSCLALSLAYDVDSRDQIELFHVRRLWPDKSRVLDLQPGQWAEFLVCLRDRPHHGCVDTGSTAGALSADLRAELLGPKMWQIDRRAAQLIEDGRSDLAELIWQSW